MPLHVESFVLNVKRKVEKLEKKGRKKSTVGESWTKSNGDEWRKKNNEELYLEGHLDTIRKRKLIAFYSYFTDTVRTNPEALTKRIFLIKTSRQLFDSSRELREIFSRNEHS